MITSERLVNFAIFPVIFFVLMLQDGVTLFNTTVATGIDGYYYVLQVNSLLESGYLYFPTNTPLVLYFFSALSSVVGDTISGIKIGILLFNILISLGVGSFLYAVTEKGWLAWTGSLLTISSVLHLYFLSEFLSNLGALTFLIWGMNGLVRFVLSKNKNWLIFSATMILASLFSHRSILWLILIFLLLGPFTFFWLKASLNRAHQALFGIILLGLFVSPLVLAWQPMFDVPPWIMSEISEFPSNPFHSSNLLEILMLLIISAVTFFFFFFNPKLFTPNLINVALFSIVVWGCLFSVNPFLNHKAGITGVVTRIDLLAFLQVAIAAPILLSIFFKNKHKIAAVITAFFVSLLFFRWFAPIPLGIREDYLQTREVLVNELPSLRKQICQTPFIIARHGDQFLVTSVLKVPSQKSPPAEGNSPCVYWLVHLQETNDQAIFNNSIKSKTGRFALIEDAELKRAFNSLSTYEQRQLLPQNAHLKHASNN